MTEISRESLLTRYGAGERDFSGWDLSGIDLSNAELQSIQLSGANLSGADLGDDWKP